MHIILEDKVEQTRLGEATSNEAWVEVETLESSIAVAKLELT
jgi:hypothetical protein